MKPEQYAVFYRELLSQKIRLLTTPEMYEKLHLFPRVYPELLPDTARMLTFPLHTEIDVRACLKVFPRFLVKDYVKSVKGSEFPAYFDENCSQEAFNVWMELFYRYRGDLLTGGICIKEFLDLKRYEGRTNEYRVFYVNHEPICISRNSGQEGKVAEPPTELVQRYRKLLHPGLRRTVRRKLYDTGIRRRFGFGACLGGGCSELLSKALPGAESKSDIVRVLCVNRNN